MTTAGPYPATLTVEQTALVLGISRSSAYRGIHTGQIPSFRIGGRILVPTAKVLDMLGLDELPAHVLEMAS